MYHTSNTAAARKRTRDNGASQRLPSLLRGTSLTPPSSAVSVMRHPEAQLELADANGAGDRARRPLRRGQTLAESDCLRRRLDRKSQRSQSPRDNVIGLALAPRT